MPRALSPEERALWLRVTADIRRDRPAKSGDDLAAAVPKPKQPVPLRQMHAKPLVPATKLPTLRRPATSATLDGRWDRQLAGGEVVPDRVVDLHGCTLESAHRRAIAALETAIRDGDRIVVLVTGKAPQPGASRLDAPLRGVIRASIGDWIAASPVSRHIAAIRPAHRRHGGAGAIYIILRRANRSLA